MKIEVHTVSAFTQEGQGGNAAAIVFDGDRFSSVQKQQIAKQVGLSETSFISPSTKATFKLEFFTPMRQIAHCGHATIASFAYLQQLGMLNGATEVSKETIDGIRQIKLQGDEVYMEQKAPIITAPDPDDLSLIAQSIGLLPAVSSHQPTLVYTGNRFLIQEVPDLQILQELTPDLQLVKAISEKYDLIGYYVFTRSNNPTIDAQSRMFAPAYGIAEESATGMAAGPLAAYLYDNGMAKTLYHIEQGRLMPQPSPSLIKVKLELLDGEITSLYAGGRATLIRKQLITLS